MSSCSSSANGALDSACNAVSLKVLIDRSRELGLSEHLNDLCRIESILLSHA
jgi:hypothetical protein